MEPIKLKALLKDIKNITVKGSKEKEIRRICNDSRRAAPGDLFIARKTEHAQEAIAAGAVALVLDHYNPFLSIPQIIADNIADFEARLAKKFYKDPAKKLFMVGVTGTNGKTTTSFLCKSLLDATDNSCGLIGSLGYYVGENTFDPSLTTPDILTNFHFLSEMARMQQKSCCMEVSSHALSQNRVEGIDYDVAIYTQLTPDHLDYHKSMENYALAKKKLFQSLKEGSLAIINKDCPYFAFMKDGISCPVISYGIENDADLMARDINTTNKGLSFSLLYEGNSYPLQSPLLGRFNVYNILAAVAMALSKKMEIGKIQDVMRNFPFVPGRMQKVTTSLPFHVYVDFAHTEDSLKRALSTLKEITKGKIITVFGCGGCRYKEKRAKMGALSEEYSDISIITNDNPRTEDPIQIIEEIVGGFSQKKALTEPDRGKAIQMAIDLADKDDAVLIAGKGAEKVQIFAHTTHPWDDVVEAEKALMRRKNAHPIHTP